MSRFQSFQALSLAILLIVAGAAVPAQAQGTHVSAAPMHSKRALHTMTALPSGKVVAIGGTDPFLTYESLVTAEVYDPVANTWTLTGSLVQGREEHAATLLADGRVLVTGGQNPTNVAWHPSTFVLNSAEIYDPATHAFTAVGPMHSYRLGHQATRLSDGRVLLTGGHSNEGRIFGEFGAFPPVTTATAEIYNPATNTFTPIAATMTVPRAYHSATLLPDGTVLIVGGLSGSINSAELFNPLTMSFTPIVPPTMPRRVHGAIRLDDGRVLITGGTGSGAGMTAEYFEPATGTFVALPPMTADYGFWGVIERMTDGRIYIQHEGAAQLFTPATNTFTPAGNAGVGAIFSAGAALSNQRVLVAGGQDFVPYTFVATAAARIFIPNESPVANAGDDRNVSPGAGCMATFTLNGAASSDPDGDALTYAWTYFGAPVGSGASLEMSLGQGTHTFTLTVSDGNGGTASDEVIIVVVDSMPPSFVAPLPVSMSLEQAGPAGTFFAIAAPSATDHCDAAPVVAVSGVPAGSIFPAGATDVTFTTTDANGNDASMTITITVGDSIAPALSVPGPMSVEAAGPSGTSVTYSVSATDAVTASPAISCSPASGSTFPITMTTVECSATDAAGNRTLASFQVKVSDTIAPVVNVPGPISVAATGPSGAAVSYSVSATDAVAGSPAVSCTRASGSVFPIGATLVDCWATDAAGNRGDASFEVSVADSTGPDITSVSSNPGSLWPPNHKMVPVRITALTGEASECRITSVSSNQPSDDDWQITGMLSVNLRAERLGSGARTYTVSVRCTDAAGNASMGATTVIVPHDQRK